MLRRLFTVALALSLLLFFGTAVAIMRSSWFCGDWITWQSSQVKDDQFFCRELNIEWNNGGLGLRAKTFHQTTHDARNAADYQHELQPEDGIHWRENHGNFGTSKWWTFSCDWYAGVSGHEAGRIIVVQFPEWVLSVACLIVPAIALVRRIRRRRTSGYGCTVCGYDLRASPDRCPECGTPVTQKATA